MTSPRLTYDPDVQALYIQLSDGEVAETLELAKNVYVDVNADGAPIGFEILHADSSLLARLSNIPNGAHLRDLLGQSAA